MKPRIGFVFLFLIPFSFGCATRSLPELIYPRTFYPIDRYPVVSQIDGLKAAAVSFAAGRDLYADPQGSASAENALPLNVLDAGVWPVRILFVNDSEEKMVIDPDQIAGWNGEAFVRRYTPEEAVKRLVRSKAFKEAIEGSQVGPLIESFLGGEILMEAAKGGVSGAAAGGVSGGASGAAKGLADVSLQRAKGYEAGLIHLITREYTGEALKKQVLYPGFRADGLIFLPSHAGIKAVEIRAYGTTGKRPIRLRLNLTETANTTADQ